MNPKIVNVTERNILGPNNTVQRAIVLTYTVGSYGPFTLTTNQQDLASGVAMQAMQNFANTLTTLPTA